MSKPDIPPGTRRFVTHEEHQALQAELVQVRAQLEEARRYEHRTARKLGDLLAAVWDHAFVKGRDVKPEDDRLYAVARRIRGER